MFHVRKWRWVYNFCGWIEVDGSGWRYVLSRDMLKRVKKNGIWIRVYNIVSTFGWLSTDTFLYGFTEQKYKKKKVQYEKKNKAFSRVSFVLFLFLTFFLSNYPHNLSSKVTRRLISVETRSLAFAYLLLWVQGRMHISATFYYYENLFLLVTFRLVNGEIFVEKNRLVFAPLSVT